MQFKNGIHRLLKYPHNLINLLKKNRREKYFIKITDIYSNTETGEVMVKYFSPAYGMTGHMTSSTFISSPLIFSVHPLQIYLVGVEAGKCIINIQETFNSNPFQTKNKKMNRYLH